MHAGIWKRKSLIKVVHLLCSYDTLLFFFSFFVILVTSINYAVYSFQSLSQESVHDCTERSSSLKKTMSEIFSNNSVSSMPFSLHGASSDSVYFIILTDNPKQNGLE